MAEQERLTNKERRERARAERKQQEAEAAKKKQRGNMRNGLITFAIVAVVAAVLLQALTGGPESLDGRIELTTSEAAEARDAAGCEMLTEESPLPDRSHVENPSQVNPDQAYTDTRPTHSGPHTAGIHAVIPDANNQINEVSSTHNLEHGTVIVWYDPDQAAGDASDMGVWAEQLNDNGFLRAQAGVGIMTSPYDDPGIASGKAIAFRAWGTAMDCDEWDRDVANSFVIDHFGTRGIGPERTLAQFPDDVLGYSDADSGDTTSDEAPLDEGFEDLDPDDLDDDEVEDIADIDDADGDEDGDADEDED
ncbi:MAG: DUF3105 domain-containing protein [Nitriliruptoraceae bacterium]|nr:DUF3105 domain-containing protein [Nitriliruptoraceae bacterium]